MIWHTFHGRLAWRADGGYYVNHGGQDVSGQFRTHMSVSHRPETESVQALHGNQPTHTLSLSHVDPDGHSHYVRIDRWTDGKVNTTIDAVTKHSHQLPPMSERLQRLIEGHAKDSEQTLWAALLDALAEEYPDFTPAVDAHAAARYATDG